MLLCYFKAVSNLDCNFKYHSKKNTHSALICYA